MSWREELWENGTDEDRQWLLGRAIADQRERKGFSQKWVAEAMGMDASAVSLIEKGKRRVPSTELWHFAQLFSVSPLVFFPDEPGYTSTVVLTEDERKLLDKARQRATTVVADSEDDTFPTQEEAVQLAWATMELLDLIEKRM